MNLRIKIIQGDILDFDGDVIVKTEDPAWKIRDASCRQILILQ